jgi:hypothetical protein
VPAHFGLHVASLLTIWMSCGPQSLKESSIHSQSNSFLVARGALRFESNSRNSRTWKTVVVRPQQKIPTNERYRVFRLRGMGALSKSDFAVN